MSYIEKGKSIAVATIKKALLEAVNNGYHKSTLKRIKAEAGAMGLGSIEEQAEYAASSLFALNEAMLEGRGVFAICEKEPRGNLDSGRHYYTIRYVENNQVHILWLQYFTEVLGGITYNRDMHYRKWMFDSGAIGMSRLIDATDGVFTFLKKLGGCYAQIDTI